MVANLLNNASKYTDRGGKIWISGAREEGRAVLRVRDTGIGIGADVLPRVFDLFTQADRSLDRSHGGLGIGLCLVKKLVDLHGGSVEAHSDGPGKGSEFIVRLQLAEAPAEAETHNIVPLTSTPCRVLVVDDNLDAAATLSMMFSSWKHTVEVAHDGLTALEMAGATGPTSCCWTSDCQALTATKSPGDCGARTVSTTCCWSRLPAMGRTKTAVARRRPASICIW